MKAVSFLIGVLLLTQQGNPQAPSNSSLGQHKDILATADSDGSLNLFVSAVRLSGMAKTFRGTDQLTVFAFNDQAFTKLPPDIRRSLLEEPRLFGPLLAHYVIRGELSARELSGQRSAKSLDGLRVRLDRRNGKQRVEGSDIERSDIACSNGIIHVIDSLEVGFVYRLLDEFQQQTTGQTPVLSK